MFGMLKAKITMELYSLKYDSKFIKNFHII